MHTRLLIGRGLFRISIPADDIVTSSDTDSMQLWPVQVHVYHSHDISVFALPESMIISLVLYCLGCPLACIRDTNFENLKPPFLPLPKRAKTWILQDIRPKPFLAEMQALTSLPLWTKMVWVMTRIVVALRDLGIASETGQVKISMAMIRFLCSADKDPMYRKKKKYFLLLLSTAPFARQILTSCN